MKLKIIKSIIFIAIFIIIFYFISKLLWILPNAISDFYKEPKDSLDVIYIGPSNVYVHFNSTLAYHLYGYTTGILSSSAEPFIFSKYLIKEAQKYQQPKLYIIDLSRATDIIEPMEERCIKENNRYNEIF